MQAEIDAPSGAWLFLTEGHASVYDFASAVLVNAEDLPSLASSGCLGRYVKVVGLFAKFSDGSYGIKRLDQVWLPSKEWGRKLCWEAEPTPTQ